jgi:peptidoglycan/LPS O-acetylase OafA/YrhL
MRPATVRSGMNGVSDAAVVVAYALGNLVFVDQQNYYRFIPLYLVTSFALVAKAVYGEGFLHKIFCVPALVNLGKVSYSFYLFHGLVVIVVCDHLALLLRGLPGALRFFVVLACAFTCSVAVAWLCHRLLEVPYFARKHSSLPVVSRSGCSASEQAQRST